MVGTVALFGAFSAVAAPESPAPATTTPASEPVKVMPLAQMNVSVAEIEARMDSDYAAILRLQELAKRSKDVLKLNCVNDRLLQVKAQRNIADETYSQLQAAMQKDSDDRQSFYDQFVIQASSIKEQHEQAKSCIGAPDVYKTESGNEVERPVVPDDPTVMTPTDTPVEPPQYASPYD